MKILILGAAGMIGQKLLNKIVEGGIGNAPISEIILHDIVASNKPNAKFPINVMTGNVADELEAVKLANLKADIIYDLAAIVSGDAEANFEKGWGVNARGGWHLLEALRRAHVGSGGEYTPRFIFTSSIAVFGPPYPERIPDDFGCRPQTSYGAQKAMMELLVSEYSRKGFLDGISLRLPTICVRPGKPNLAASSFYSGIIREPLNNVEAILPVPDTVRHWFASPRSASNFLITSATVDTAKLDSRRSLNLPGVSCTVAQQIEALRKVAGEKAVGLIKSVPDPDILKIVSGWPRDFDPKRAQELGFKAEKDFEEIIRNYLEDDY